MRLLIIALLLILIPIHGFAWPEELEFPSVLDRVTQEMSDGAVDAYEAQQARISVDVESKEFEACLNSDDSHACLSQVVQPYLKSVATPAAAAISSAARFSCRGCSARFSERGNSATLHGWE